MTRGINELKKITKHISFQGKCKFDQRKCNSNQWWYNDKCLCECKKHDIWEKDYIWNPSTCICEYGKYSVSIMDDSMITCDEIIEETVTTNFNEKKSTCKTQNFYILLAFLLLTVALLIALSNCCCLIKYQAKKNIYYHFTRQVIN